MKSNSNNKYNVFFTNLANSLKIDIILSLRQKDKNVSEISRELKVEQSKISHALSSLKSCNIVSARQEGKERFYSLNKDTILPMLNLIDNHAKDYCKCRCCAGKCREKK